MAGMYNMNRLSPPSASESSRSLSSAFMQNVQSMAPAYPPLNGFSKHLSSGNDPAATHVESAYLDRFGRPPGRCSLLVFKEDGVLHRPFETTQALREAFRDSSIQDSTIRGRLWILEDLERSWMSTLADHLGVDPLVFSEQRNTFNFTDSNTIPFRTIPSLVQPEKLFTLRYYEFRQLNDIHAINFSQNYMTFAMNRRRYERWRDIDTANLQNKWRHAFIRRCASFWSNQHDEKSTWDAVMLVDPAFDSFEWHDPDTLQNGAAATIPSPEKFRTPCTILSDRKSYVSRDALWKGRAWSTPDAVGLSPDTSAPYHAGSSTLTYGVPNLVDEVNAQTALREHADRNLTSPLDEMVFHWTKIASRDLVSAACEHSVNSAHYLLKYIATHWVNQMELIACTVALSEYLADDHEAKVDTDKSANNWRKDLKYISNATRDINHMRRQLAHFEQACALNLERLGHAVGADNGQEGFSTAIRDAQYDFAVIHARLQAFCERLAGLRGLANDLANLHTAFQTIRTGEFGLRVSFFAGIVFPMTLVSGILSMQGEYLPGRERFWVFWAISIPLVLVLTLGLSLGQRPIEILTQRRNKVLSTQS